MDQESPEGLSIQFVPCAASRPLQRANPDWSNVWSDQALDKRYPWYSPLVSCNSRCESQQKQMTFWWVFRRSQSQGTEQIEEVVVASFRGFFYLHSPGAFHVGPLGWVFFLDQEIWVGHFLDQESEKKAWFWRKRKWNKTFDWFALYGDIWDSLGVIREATAL